MSVIRPVRSARTPVERVRSSASSAISSRIAEHFAVPQFVELFMQRHDLDLGLQVDLVVVRRVEAVAFGLPVLRHHDHRRLHGGQHRQDEVEENIGVGVEGVAVNNKTELQ